MTMSIFLYEKLTQKAFGAELPSFIAIFKLICHKGRKSVQAYKRAKFRLKIRR